MNSRPKLYIPFTEVIRELDPDVIPVAIADVIASVTDHLAYIQGYFLGDAQDGTFYLKLQVIIDELVLDIPIVDGLAFVIGGGPVEIKVIMYEGKFDAYLRIEQLRLRFPREWLKPVIVETDPETGVGNFVVDEDQNHFIEIVLPFGLRVTDEFDIDPIWPGSEAGTLELPPSMIGNTGVIIQVDDIAFNFSGNGSKPEKAPDDWKGLYIENATVYIPEVMNGEIHVEGLGIGSGGFYGEIEGEWNLEYDPDGDPKFSGNLAGRVMGMEGGISSIAIEFEQCIPVEFDIQGQILFPFFDEPVEVSIGVGIDGDFQLALADTDEDGMFMLRKESVLEAKLESIAFEKEDERFIASLSGSVKPLVPGVDWPEFDVDKLAIDSEGNVQVDGGWIDVPDKLTFDLRGFTMEVTQVGFGKEEDEHGDEYKWIGLSGGIQLVEGLEAGASVEGLKIKWWDDGRTGFELNGVGVNFEIPDVLKFEGQVAFLSDGVDGFKGDINLNLMTIGLEMDAALVVGKRELEDGGVYKFFYIYLDAQLPAGIPLGCSGAGLYGIAGLFAYNMEPNKGIDETWYGDEEENGWYKREPEGVTSVDKWGDAEGSLAIGGGITLGTMADNGYLISAKALLVIVIPGPIILIEGKANILKSRSSLSEEGIFKALAVIDNRAGQFLMNIEAAYKYDEEEGRVLDIHGGAEVFFDYHNPNNWRLYLGEKDPREKRIRAEIIRLFKAEVYFMLDPASLKWGFWFGFDEKWEFGPVKIVAAAWAEGGVDASWKPEHFWGKIWMHGELGIKVFFFDFSLYLDAGIEGNTPTPYYILMALKVGINLPWPLPDFEIGIDLKWERPEEPPWPLPLKEVAIGHDMVQENIALPRGELLLPDYEDPDPNNKDFINEDEDILWEEPVIVINERNEITIGENTIEIPAVPLDARPVLTFGKPVWDTAGVGDNAYPLDPEWQKLGHEGEDENLKDFEYKFELTALILERKIGSVWERVADKGVLADPHPRSLYGTWQATEDGEGNPTQTKLQLWTENPFSYSRYSTRDYEDGFIEGNPDYPCVPDYQAEKKCVNFDGLSLGATYQDLEHGSITIDSSWTFRVVDASECCPTDYKNALCFEKEKVFITFPEPVCWFHIKAHLQEREIVMVDVINRDGERLSEWKFYYPDNDGNVNISSGEEGCSDAECEIKSIIIKEPKYSLCVFEICYLPASECEKEKTYQDYRRRAQESLAHWFDEKGKILEPYTTYRLHITTRVSRKENNEEIPRDKNVKPIWEYVFFRTEGPPGFVELEGKELPDPQNNGTIPHEHPLKRLDLYVKDTTPENGQNPFYRAYDIGVEFNQPYVELMYMIARHDLGIYLFDNNGQPVRDAFGRIITLSNVWGKVKEKREDSYLDVLENAPCLDFDRDSIPKNDRLENSVRERFLLPQKLYEARIIPMLFHETFDSESPEKWEFVEEGNTETPHAWSISTDTIDDSSIYYLSQTSNIHTIIDGELDLPACRGTYALYGKESWTDYRLTVVLASGTAGAIGVMFRYQDENTYYRFSMDREREYRRLIKRGNGDVTILDQDKWIYEEEQIYEIIIEAIGSTIRVFLGGKLLFDAEDEDISSGKIALYCWANEDVHFYEVMVEDLSENAKSVYSFPFTTSRYANFFHHIHSFNERLWTARLPEFPESSDWDEIRAEIIGSPQQVVDSEKFEKIWPEVVRLPQRVEIDLVERDTQNIGFLLKSPEPIEWKRVGLELKQSHTLIHPEMPGAVKLTSFKKDETKAQLELLVREKTPLYNWKIEYAENPENPEWMPFYTFKGPELYSRTEFSDEDFSSLPTAEGSYFIVGDTDWKDYRLTTDFELAGDDQKAGILFRYRDEGNYYKLSVSNAGGVRLFKKFNNDLTFLGPPSNDPVIARFRESLVIFGDMLVEHGLSEPPETENILRYRLTVEVEESKIRVFFNGELCFEIDDENHIERGCIGVFFLAVAEVTFHELSVIALEKKPLPSGRVIRIDNANKRQITRPFVTDVIFNERVIPELITGRDAAKAFRIIDENGAVVHQKTFLPDEEFDDAPSVKIVPSPDGTTAFLLPEDSSYIEENKLYRFTLTFSGEKDELPILKQWGKCCDETANIEFQLSEE